MKNHLRDNYSMAAPTVPIQPTHHGDIVAGLVVIGSLIAIVVYLLLVIAASIDLRALVEFLSSVLP